MVDPLPSSAVVPHIVQCVLTRLRRRLQQQQQLQREADEIDGHGDDNGGDNGDDKEEDGEGGGGGGKAKGGNTAMNTAMNTAPLPPLPPAPLDYRELPFLPAGLKTKLKTYYRLGENGLFQWQRECLGVGVEAAKVRAMKYSSF